MLNNHIYCLVDEASEYDGNVAKNIAMFARRIQRQIQTHAFNAFDAIFVIRFLSAFVFAFDRSEFREVVAFSLFHFQTKGSFSPALNRRLCLKP